MGVLWAGLTTRVPQGRLLVLLAAVVLFLTGCGTSIHDEAAAGNLDQVRAMLDENPDLLHSVDKLGKTPLFFAITYGKMDVVELLLERGADINAKDGTGLTPLHVAAWWTRTDRAAFLLDHGAQLEARDDFGDTPLHVAAMHGRLAMVDFLVKRGAGVNARNNEGLTPAELAGRHREEKAVRLLDSLASDTS